MATLLLVRCWPVEWHANDAVALFGMHLLGPASAHSVLISLNTSLTIKIRTFLFLHQLINALIKNLARLLFVPKFYCLGLPLHHQFIAL